MMFLRNNPKDVIDAQLVVILADLYAQTPEALYG